MRKQTELITLIADELKNDPAFIEELKILIDTVPGEISDKDLFELLKPAFTQKAPTLDDIFSERGISGKADNSFVVSPESIDMFFYPAVRNKLKQWQQTFLDKKSTDSEKIKAEGNFERVFKRLLWKGQGKNKKKALTQAQRGGIIKDFDSYDKGARACFKQNNIAVAITKTFNEEGKTALEAYPNMERSPESIRNALLAVKYSLSLRSVEKIIEPKRNKLLKEYKSLTIRGTGSKAVFTPHVKK